MKDITDIGLFEHFGGTRTKIDMKYKDMDFSLKRHKSGTFDYINTTKLPNEFIRYKKIFNDFFKQKIDEYTLDEEGKIPDNNSLRKKLLELSKIFLIEMKSDNIQKLLFNEYKNYPENIIVNDVKNKRYILSSKYDFMREMYKYYDWQYYLKLGKGSASAQIWRRMDNKEINTNLRLRLTNNNGINAGFGFSKSNKSTSAVIKIQQEKVDNLLNILENPIIDYY